MFQGILYLLAGGDIFSTRRGVHPPDSHDATSLSFHLPPPYPFCPAPFNRSPGYHFRENFGISDACRWVLEHFRHNQKLCPPNFLIFAPPRGFPWRIFFVVGVAFGCSCRPVSKCVSLPVVHGVISAAAHILTRSDSDSKYDTMHHKSRIVDSFAHAGAKVYSSKVSF